MNVITRRRLNLALTADRRAQQGVTPKLDAEVDPAGPVLTRRERRVKDILLKELRTLNGKTQASAGRRTWNEQLSYAERKYLEQTLDAEYIDKELDKMRRQLRLIPYSTLLSTLPALLITYALIITWWLGIAWLTLAALFLWHNGRTLKKSLQRRIFIYEALRELSDADELDVTMDRVTREADALIARLVDQELALDQRRPNRN